MTKSILCTVIIGILVGATAFFVPKMLLGIFIFCAVMRLFHCCCHRHHSRGRFHMADNIRAMSDEEYADFKAQMVGSYCNSGYHHHQHCGCKSQGKGKCTSKDKETTK
jgi:hypothetical protein